MSVLKKLLATADQPVPRVRQRGDDPEPDLPNPMEYETRKGGPPPAEVYGQLEPMEYRLSEIATALDNFAVTTLRHAMRDLPAASRMHVYRKLMEIKDLCR